MVLLEMKGLPMDGGESLLEEDEEKLVKWFMEDGNEEFRFAEPNVALLLLKTSSWEEGGCKNTNIS
jgi:hypothetical protein